MPGLPNRNLQPTQHDPTRKNLCEPKYQMLKTLNESRFRSNRTHPRKTDMDATYNFSVTSIEILRNL